MAVARPTLSRLQLTRTRNQDPDFGIREEPECVVLKPRNPELAAARTPVRIFLGTQPEQIRAERVFFFSIEKARDPDREYRIYRMSSLRGFDRRDWRTGFTNYRFAIPEFAGFQGRAIYNDVDQIYAVDPASLFDMDMDGHGYRSVSAMDTSVMLIDCQRMAHHWNWRRATDLPKKRLVGEAADEPGLWGPLESGWNARDMEYREGESRLLHYTALHLQPWHPTPEQYSYHHHPLGEIWLRLEREADQQGYEVFTRECPSELFRHDWPRFAEASAIASLASLTPVLQAFGIERAAALGLSEDRTQGALRLEPLHLGRTGPGAPAVLVPEGTLDRLPVTDMPWLLDTLFEASEQLLCLQVVCGRSDAEGLEQGRARPAAWWRHQVRRVAARHPGVAWRLETRSGAEGTEAEAVESRLASGPAGNAATPRVWVLYGERMGDNAQLRCLAEALGWPFEEKRLTFNGLAAMPNWLAGEQVLGLARHGSDALEPPWPDVVLAAGRRSAPVARWIKRRSGGRSQLIHLNRPWAPLSAFDLVITTPQYGLPARENVLHNVLPLNRTRAHRVQQAEERWRDALKGLPAPRIAGLIGGDARPYRLDEATAARLGRQLNDLARQSGGSLLLAFGARCSKTAAQALLQALEVPHHAHHAGMGHGDNPYPAYLGMADAFVVTGDSASMLAEACATGRPVALFEPPEWPDLRLRLVRGLRGILAGKTARASYRGTPRQQGRGGRLYDWLVEQGLVTSTRDLSLLHGELLARGLVARLGEDPVDQARVIPLANDLERAVARVRATVEERRVLASAKQ